MRGIAAPATGHCAVDEETPLKSFIVVDDLISSGPVFLTTVWPFAALMKETVGAENIYIPAKRKQGLPLIPRKFRIYRDAATVSKPWRQKILAQIDPNGPNVLFVLAFSVRSIELARALHPVWDVFDRRVLMIEENIEPGSLTPSMLGGYDLVTVFCKDLARLYHDRLDIAARYLAPHTDTLRYHSLSDYRPIDMLLVGRRRNDRHDPLFRHYSTPQSRRLFLDFMTPTQANQSREDAFALLCNTYARSKIAFCYEASDVPRFRRRSPLLSRWVHAWAAGCSVVGSRPTGDGAAEGMDWPESMFDLPADPGAAIDLLEGLLADDAGLDRRRRRNVAEAIGRHDSRLRLKFILDELRLPYPAALADGLAKLEELRLNVLQDQGDGLTSEASMAGIA